MEAQTTVTSHVTRPGWNRGGRWRPPRASWGGRRRRPANFGSEIYGKSSRRSGQAALRTCGFKHLSTTVPEPALVRDRSSRRCRERCTRTFSTKLGDLITNGYGYTILPSIIREFAFRQVRTLGSLLWRQVALQLPRVLGPARTEDPNASSAAPITSESSGHSSGTWKQRSSARSLCDYLVIDGPLRGQWANGGCAASRRISLHMRADQPVPRVARTRAQHSCSELVSGRPLGT